MNVVQPYVIL
uniref:Uncharacterized protein n=1 Tax=Anguilla anguilla TaxID=7936 RepID=A0A0E9TL40_ANGAN